jgi:hypothetical protein
LTKIAPEIFESLPYAEVLKNGGAATVSLAWRQMVRTGEVDPIIEDVGVKSIKIVRPTLEDFKSKGQSQFDRIAEYLKQEGERTGRNKMQCESFFLAMFCVS